jgi:superfamily II DNA helicase RecQ
MTTQFSFFRVHKENVADATAELNHFLRAHRIVNVDRQFVADGERSCWFFCVEYFEGGQQDTAPGVQQPRGKVDYREVLSAPDFALYSKLRDKRKALAEAEAVPPYTIFTNEQLAEMVTSKTDSLAALRKINGVGESRVTKYGAEFLQILNDEKSRTPDAANSGHGEPAAGVAQGAPGQTEQA